MRIKWIREFIAFSACSFALMMSAFFGAERHVTRCLTILLHITRMVRREKKTCRSIDGIQKDPAEKTLEWSDKKPFADLDENHVRFNSPNGRHRSSTNDKCTQSHSSSANVNSSFRKFSPHSSTDGLLDFAGKPFESTPAN